MYAVKVEAPGNGESNNLLKSVSASEKTRGDLRLPLFFKRAVENADHTQVGCLK